LKNWELQFSVLSTITLNNLTGATGAWTQERHY